MVIVFDYSKARVVCSFQSPRPSLQFFDADLAAKENRDWGRESGGKMGSSVVLNRRVIVREGAGFDLVFEQIPEISP